MIEPLRAWLVVGYISALFVLPAEAENLAEEDLQIEAEIAKNGTNMAFGHGALWVASGFTALRIDPNDNTLQAVNLEGASQKQRRILVGPKSVWLADVGGDLIFRINPDTGDVGAKISVPMLSTNGSIAVGAGSVWVITEEGFEKTLTRVNIETGLVEAQIELPTIGFGVAAAGEQIWVSSGMKDEIYRVDPATNSIVQTIATASSPRMMVEAAGSLWVHVQGDGSVQRIDSATGDILATISAELPLGAGEIVAWKDGVSLSTPYQLLFLRIDAETNAVAVRVIGRQGADDHDVGAGSIWLGGSNIRRVAMP